MGIVGRLALLAMLLSVGFPGAPAAEPTHRVGLATIGITPGHPVRLNGFGNRSRESQGVRLPIHARALAIGPLAAPPDGVEVRGDGCAVVIVVETLGIPAGITERLAARLAAHGVKRENLALCATHTHSAPMVRDCAPTLFGRPIPADHWSRILAHTADLEAQLERVALAALADRKPATLGVATGRLDFAFNRRTPGGPVDHDLPLLVVRTPDGALRGLFSTYACHAVTLSDDLVSGDWPGYAMHHLERRHPGCTALVSIGCGADSNPRGGVLGSATEAADLLGREYADEVDRLLAGAVRPITALPTGRIERVSVGLAPLPSRAEWEARAGQGGAVGHHARTQLERLDRGEALATAIDHPVQSIVFGTELAWVFLAGEVVVDYATRLEQELDGKRIWLHAYANACPGYVPSERILREGGYEGGGAMIYYDIPGPYAAGLEESLVGAVMRQLAADYGVAADDRGGGAATPDTFRVAPGFRVELVAAEPLVHSPVAVAFGPDSRVWVAEMIDYPSGLPDGRPAGRVRCLHDDDGDGLPDRATTFLDGIPFPTGVTPWRDGVLVCAAPDILLARDGDGDGRADTVEPLFTGFATHNAQARVNGLEAALDGWLEGACGLFGGRITSTRTGAMVDLGGRDFRIDPDRGLIEPLVGASQQGRVRDDEGNWFGCNSGALALHFPLRHAWLERNPLVAPRRIAVSIAAEPGPGTLFPLSQPQLFALSGPVGRPTAACGLAVYRDDLLGADGTPLSGDLFTCEPANNVVHHQRPVARGASFAGVRIASERDREFLASTDPRFRPVQARTAPDGSLWVVDMARTVIEHPDWIPPDTRATLDLRGGAERGRIWRVVAVDGAGARVARPVPRIDRLSGAELAAALDTPNGTVRDLVQQAICWRDDRAAVPMLHRLSAESPRAAVRLQALATLSRVGSLPEALLDAALADPSPAVRRQAVRLAEGVPGRLRPYPAADVAVHGVLGGARAATIARLAADPSAAVRLEVAAVADRLPEESAAEVLVYLAERQGDDAVFEAVLASSLSPGSARAVANGLAARGGDGALTPGLEALLIHAARRVDAVALAELLARARSAATPEPSATALDRLARLVAAAATRPDGALEADENRWRDCLAGARGALAAADDRAVAAARLLGHGRRLGLPAADALVAALGPRVPTPVRTAALAALRDDGGADVAEGLLAAWPGLAPGSRREAVALLLERPAWAAALLAAVADGRVGRAEIDLASRRGLADHPHEPLRLQARALFAADEPPTAGQGEAITQAVAAIGGGDGGRGATLFARHCAACHAVEGVGRAVGPDITPHAFKPPVALVTALFDPDRAVDPRYQAYVVELDDGRVLGGLIADEAPASFVVVGGDGARTEVLRATVESLRSTGRSLMPEGFARTLSPGDVADLWAWLSARQPPSKTLPGNVPARVAVAARGATALAAAGAEIRGGDIVFETELANVGHWHGVDDTVRWPLAVAVPREVEVWGEWACDPTSAGNRLRVEGGTPALVTTVESTGAWSRYVLVPIGRTTLAAGSGAVVVRADGALRGALVDLRALHLVAPGDRPRPVGAVADDESSPSRPRKVSQGP